MEEVELEVRPGALAAIAKRAIKRRTGARGLRSIVEQALLGTMYELPSQKDVKRVVLDENAVVGKGTPLLIYDDKLENEPEGRRVAPKKLKDAAAKQGFENSQPIDSLVVKECVRKCSSR